MRLLVGLHHLELGGSQLNALDLAVSVRNQGHQVAIVGNYRDEPGPVADLARRAGLPVIAVRHRAERLGRAMPVRPGLSRALTRAVREFRADLVHAYEYSVALDAFYGPHLRLGTPVVTTVYGMRVPRWMPRYGGLVVGTAQLVAEAGAFRPPPALIEPPVNTDVDDPAVVDGHPFRQRHGIGPDEIVLGVVSRLEPDMKAEGVLRAIRAVRLLADDRLRLVVTGGGPSYADVAAEAERANAALGRPAVVLTGPMDDPRPAYAAADIALGMGGSALRAMAFGRPLVVLGIRGFSRTCAPETIDYFFRWGFYGLGDGDLDPAPLAAQLGELVDDRRLRVERGDWGRQLVLGRFSLKAATQTLHEVYAGALRDRPGAAARLREGLRVAAHKGAADLVPAAARQRIRRMLG
ncbi:glycosyltransferase family 4 protein [Micromonospora sp. C28SCA-DRY-2]|uniref:glycosyltransferase family 4 protein n=1 Tax=Micromonospora sp. C28SCA-DRY-2 TaxID=3059522 RepID=UPI0026774BA5|nr:glycosyltransferase family 4 protein [Micromonospora sp. C28SCA-DRY-2]MDO3704290.1 glycosyltransferase family 4 protein [Micromonospora sp. C28SCA-DRY-2]